MLAWCVKFLGGPYDYRYQLDDEIQLGESSGLMWRSS